MSLSKPGRKQPVPLLLSSFEFPTPPTHIPSSPLPTDPPSFDLSSRDPPPSLPPASPLPPVPGPSPLSDQETLRLINVSRASRRTSKGSVYSSSSKTSSEHARDWQSTRLDRSHSPSHSCEVANITPPTPSPSVHTFGVPSRPVSLAESRRSGSVSSLATGNPLADRSKSPGLAAYLDQTILEDDEARSEYNQSLTTIPLDDLPRASPSPVPQPRQGDDQDEPYHTHSDPDDSIAHISMQDLPQDDEDDEEEMVAGQSTPNSSVPPLTPCAHIPPLIPPKSTVPPPSAFPRRFATPTSSSKRDSVNYSLPSSFRERRSSSPGIEDMMARTPRPRRRSTSSLGSQQSRSHSRRSHISTRSASGSTSVGPPRRRGYARQSSASRPSSTRTSGIEVRINGSELPYLKSQHLDEDGDEWNEDSYVEDYGTVIKGGDGYPADGGDEGGMKGGVAGPEEGDHATASELDDFGGDASDGSESSLDLHTPLPKLMLRDGLLSPHSKILPDGLRTPSPLPTSAPQDSSSLTPGARPGSTLSVLSTTGSIMTKSGVYKDERDTVRRRVRHRDGKLLRGGLGLTTGLGWSDSEDEDAPSPLTRRLSSIGMSRSPSTSSLPSSLSPHPLSRSYSGDSISELKDRSPPLPSNSHRKGGQKLKGRASLPSTASTLALSIPEHGLYPIPVDIDIAPKARSRSKSVGRKGVGGGYKENHELHDHGILRDRENDRDRDKDSSSTTSSTLSLMAPVTPVEAPTHVILNSPSALFDANRDKTLPPLPLQPRKKQSTPSLRSPASVASIRSMAANCNTTTTSVGGHHSNSLSTSSAASSSINGHGSRIGIPQSSSGLVTSKKSQSQLKMSQSQLKMRKSAIGLARSTSSATSVSLSASSSVTSLALPSSYGHAEPTISNSLSTPNPGVTTSSVGIPRRSLNSSRTSFGSANLASSIPSLNSRTSNPSMPPLPSSVRPLRLGQQGQGFITGSGGIPSLTARTGTGAAGGVGGGVPKPRTGTGMVYKKSSIVGGPVAMQSRLRLATASGAVGTGVGIGTQKI